MTLNKHVKGYVKVYSTNLNTKEGLIPLFFYAKIYTNTFNNK